ncbi:MAG: FxsA family protein [Nitrospinota bacterium]
MFLPVTAFFAIGTGVELYGLKWVSDSISIINTISLVMFSFLVGIVVSRSYGNECFERIQRSLKSREAPSDEVLNGAVMSLCSMLLITPGVVTDTIGILIMIPATRGVFKEMALNLTQKRIQTGQQYFFFQDN